MILRGPNCWRALYQFGRAPRGANLRVVKGWTAEQFLNTIRTGVDPSGHQLSDQMPWRDIARLDDAELTAVYEYLITLNYP